jgi:hypothetical protein
MMNKFDLSERIDAAYHPAIDRTRRVLVAQSFALALSEFIEDEFKALAEVNVDFSANASFLISADYTALNCYTGFWHNYSTCQNRTSLI